MALCLRVRIPPSQTLLILDLEVSAMARLSKESEALRQQNGIIHDGYRVEIASNARELAEHSVSHNSLDMSCETWL
jgi:signal transduction protein with GAF and PtsI domain